MKKNLIVALIKIDGLWIKTLVEKNFESERVIENFFLNEVKTNI